MNARTVKLVRRHLAAGGLAAAAVAGFWLARPNWSPEMRLWKSFGDAAFLLLIVTLMIGPLSKIWRRWARLLAWRRETGIWFGLMALVHTVLIVDGWARWSVARFFGYEEVPQLGRVVRLEPGFGLANLLGLVAIGWTLLLMATSSDRALRGLGTPAWRWIHSGVHVVFYTVVAHTAYFLFIHFTESFHKRPVPADWFRLPFLTISLGLIALQIWAFMRTMRADKRSAAARAVRHRKDLAVKG